MATYSNNTTIKINTKINASVSSVYPAPPSSTTYTVPANMYLDFIAYASSSGTSGTSYISVDSVNVVSATGNGGSSRAFNVKAGPGAVITLYGWNQSNPGSSGGAHLHGVLFSNTP